MNVDRPFQSFHSLKRATKNLTVALLVPFTPIIEMYYAQIMSKPCDLYNIMRAIKMQNEFP